MQFNIVYKAVSGIEIRETAEVADRTFKEKSKNERMLAGNYAANQVRKHPALVGVVSIQTAS